MGGVGGEGEGARDNEAPRVLEAVATVSSGGSEEGASDEAATTAAASRCRSAW